MTNGERETEREKLETENDDRGTGDRSLGTSVQR